MILNLEAYFKPRATLTRFFLYLSFFAIVGTYDLFASANTELRLSAMLALATCVAVSIVCISVLRSIPAYSALNPINFFITSIIIFLLIHPTESPLWFAGALVLAAGSKIIRYKSQPIVNPAAAGLIGVDIIGSVLNQFTGSEPLPVLISWWGADMVQGIIIPGLSTELFFIYGIAIVFLTGFAYFTFSFRRLTYSSTFFMTCACVMMIANLRSTQSSIETFEFIVTSLFTSFAFLTLVMIPEPKTSPVLPKQQIMTALLGGIFFYAVYAGHIPFFDQGMAFLYTLVFMNAVTLATKFLPIRYV